MERGVPQRHLHHYSAGSFVAPCRYHRHRGRQLQSPRKRAGNGPAEEKMTSAASLLQPDSNPALFVSSVLTLYVDLPDTPLRASTQDQRQARAWFDRHVPLAVVE